MSHRLAELAKVTVALALLTQVAANHAPKRTARRRPSQTAQPTLTLEVEYGDKTSTFTIVPAGGGATLTFDSTESARAARSKTRSMPAKDFDYLRARLAKLPGENNDPRLCPRAIITLTQGTRRTYGCLLAPNPMAKELRSIVNLLSMYL